jgi:hypothetical protein
LCECERGNQQGDWEKKDFFHVETNRRDLKQPSEAASFKVTDRPMFRL